MKKIILSLVLFLGIISHPAFTQSIDWSGTYRYEKSHNENLSDKSKVAMEELIVNANPLKKSAYTFVYEVTGYQTYYKLKGSALANENSIEFYLNDIMDGVYHDLDIVNLESPFFVLKYENKQLMTRWMQPIAQKKFHPYFKKEN